MKLDKDKPYRGKEFDPCDQQEGAVSGIDSESMATKADLDREDGQVEGVFGSLLGRESGTFAGDGAAAEYVARDAEIARQEILDEESQKNH